MAKRPAGAGGSSRRRQLAYGAVMLASSAMNNLFVTYYIAMFAALPSLTPGWFYAGQLVFMVWNGVNDPLFGWLSDTLRAPAWLAAAAAVRGGSGGAPARTASPAVARRAAAIRWGGLAWALAFVFVWHPWTASATLTGVHFTLALVAYDSALSLVEVNHAALLADMAATGAERAGANAWAATLGAVGSGSSLAAYATWDPADLRGFRRTALAVALLAAAVFWWAAGVLGEAGGSGGAGESARQGGAPCATELLPASSAAESALAADSDCEAAPPTGVLELASVATVCGAGEEDGAVTCGSVGGAAAGALAPSQALGARSLAVALGGARPRHAAAAAASAATNHDRIAAAPTVATAGAATYVAAVAPAMPPTAASAAGGHAARQQPAPGLLLLLRQLAASANFRVFTGVAVLQSLDCTFEKNFFVPLMDALLPALLAAATARGSAGGADTASGGSMPAALRGAVISLSFLLPHVCVVGWTPLLRRAGLPATLRAVLGSRGALLVAAVALSWAVGGLGAASSSSSSSSSVWVPRCVLGFLLANRVLSETVCRLFPLVKAELVDEDAAVHGRTHGAVTASVMGAAEALAKAGQSLAPMLAYAVLPQLQRVGGGGGGGGAGGVSVWAEPVAAASSGGGGGGGLHGRGLRALAALGGAARAATMADVAWGLLLGVPAATVALQAALWRGYRRGGGEGRRPPSGELAK